MARIIVEDKGKKYELKNNQWISLETGDPVSNKLQNVLNNKLKEKEEKSYDKNEKSDDMDDKTFKYKEKEYILGKNGWLLKKSNTYVLVNDTLQKELNREYNKQKGSEPYDFEKLWKDSARFRSQNDFGSAIKNLETIMEKENNKKNLSLAISRLSSCYRNVRRPDDAIALYDKAISLKIALLDGFLTSIGSAYMDIYERARDESYLDKAKYFLDRACASSNAKSNPELAMAYKKYHNLRGDK